MDRTFRGLIAGSIASIFMNACNLIDYYFIHITHLRYLDWIAVLASGHKPQSTIEVIVDFVLAIWWDGILGIVFVHLLNKTTSRGFIIKSSLYSTFLWFAFHGIAVLFRINPIVKGQPFSGRLINLFGSLLWGIILGWLLKKFDKPPKSGNLQDEENSI